MEMDNSKAPLLNMSVIIVEHGLLTGGEMQKKKTCFQSLEILLNLIDDVKTQLKLQEQDDGVAEMMEEEKVTGL